MFARKQMNQEEHRIWEASFAAVMVAHFQRTYEDLQALDVTEAYDKALAYMNAESAETIADAVVDRMREWEKGR